MPGPRGIRLGVVVFLMFSSRLLAHEGKITGKVADQGGGVLPGVTVVVTDQKTRATRTTTTAGDGTYSVASAPGLYTVTAELTGFRKGVLTDVTVTAGAPATADFTMVARLASEITVTAMKREQTVYDTPVSVAAPTEAELRQRGIDDIEGVARNVAGFSVQNLGPGQSQVAIRGVSSGQIARDQPGVKEQVGAYLDESVISLSLFTPDLDLFDVSRMEVLRGPQGTLFGSGSESGTVRYITNQPELGVKKVFGEFGGNEIDGGNQGGNVKLGANTPLGNSAALRVAAYYTRFAGYMDSPGTTVTAWGAIRPDPNTTKQDVNTGDRYGVRAAVKIAPNDDWSITPRFVYQKVETDGWNRIDDFNILANGFTTTRPAVTLGPREQFVQVSEPFNDKLALGDLNVGYRFGSLALSSITSYADRNVDVIRDAGALTASVTGGVGLPEPIYSLNAPLDDHTKAHVFTQELRLSGGKTKTRWVAGGFYAHTKRDYGQNLLVAGFERLSGIRTKGLAAPKDVLFFSDLHYKLDQFALFGEGTYNASEDVSITAGLRYYHFSEDKQQIFDGIFANDNNGTSLVSQPGSANAGGLAPRLIATYRVSGNTNLNAQVSKGFRLGGINDPLNVPLCTRQDLQTFGGHDNWTDETAWNYELGSKSRFLGGKGSFNVSAFYMDVKNLQATVTAGSCSSRVVFNVPKSRSVGGELEFSIAPSTHFDFDVTASVTDAKLNSTVTSTAPDGSLSVVSGIRDGNRLPSVPEFQLAAAATYRWEVSRGWLGYATGSYQHVGSRFTQVGDEEPGFGVVDLLSFPHTIGAPLTQRVFTFNPLLPAYDILNLRVGFVRRNWEVSLFGNNLTDERALLSLDRERGLRARVGFVTNQPRTFGLSVYVNL